jgi:hypothetical protein
MKKNWKKYVKGLSSQKKEHMLLVLLEHMLDSPDMLDYREGGPAEFPDEPPSKECIYWTGSGEDILKK